MNRFPEVAQREIRYATFPEGFESIPPGEYAFFELYCEEDACDCRRVLLQVVGKSSEGKVWATISYGWGASEVQVAARDLVETTPSGAFLDPLCPQSECAVDFLDFFEAMIDGDPAYVERLKRHYAMFKQSPASSKKSWESPDPARRARRPNPESLLKRRRRR